MSRNLYVIEDLRFSEFNNLDSSFFQRKFPLNYFILNFVIFSRSQTNRHRVKFWVCSTAVSEHTWSRNSSAWGVSLHIFTLNETIFGICEWEQNVSAIRNNSFLTQAALERVLREIFEMDEGHGYRSAILSFLLLWARDIHNGLELHTFRI